MATVPAPPPALVIEQTFGPFVTGIMLQQLLMGVIVVQVYVRRALRPRFALPRVLIGPLSRLGLLCRPNSSHGDRL